MKVLAFLQNAWYRNPDKIAALFARRPERRNDLVARFLFAGCLTGRRLRQALGNDWCNRIIWEETSPRLGDHSSAKFKADQVHMLDAIDKHEPDVIVCFGSVARDALARLIEQSVMLGCKGRIAAAIVTAPHPAARYGGATRELEMVKFKLRDFEKGNR
jgi:hypothetical protein